MIHPVTDPFVALHKLMTGASRATQPRTDVSRAESCAKRLRKTASESLVRVELNGPEASNVRDFHFKKQETATTEVLL